MYPSVQDLLQNPNKERLLEVHRALRSNLTPVCIIVLSLGIIFWLSAVLPDSRVPASIAIIGGFNVRWLALVPAIIVLEIYRRFEDDLYVLGAAQITHYAGRLSLNSSVPSVKYGDIKEIGIKQNIIGRLFNFGDIYLDSPAHDGPELIIKGVYAPMRLTLLIEDLRDNSMGIPQPTDQNPAQ